MKLDPHEAAAALREMREDYPETPESHDASDAAIEHLRKVAGMRKDKANDYAVR